MDIVHISILSNVVIAISTVFGVAVASAYYMKEIAQASISIILLSIAFYILLTSLITLEVFRLILKWQTKKA